MKGKLALPPVLALIIVAGWSGSERYLISGMEEENAALKARLVVQAAGSDAVASSSMTKSPGQPSPCKKLAALMAEVRRTGSKLAMLQLEQQCKALSKEELISALDEMDGSNSLDTASAELNTLLFEQLCLKDSQSALARFADPSRSDRAEMLRTLESTMKEWSPDDLMMAEAWFGEQDSAGLFADKSLTGGNGLRGNFENALIGAWIAADPATAAARLSALPADKRGDTLWSLAAKPVKEADQPAFANLVRKLAPEKSRTATLASLASTLASSSAEDRVIGNSIHADVNDLPSDYTAITDFLDRIQATPEEREASVKKCASSRVGFLSDGHVTRETIDVFRAWAMQQAPSVVDQVTSKLLWRQTARGATFSQVVEQVQQYRDASGTDQILIEFLSPGMPEAQAENARRYAEQISDPKLRQIILERLK
jgi:hypothetical protein